MDVCVVLPPNDGAEWTAFRGLVNDLVWDPRDLVIGVVGQQDVPDSPAGIKASGVPRRLGVVIDYLTDMGAQLVPMFVDGTESSPGFSDLQLQKLGDLVAARNPYQVCIPDDLVGDDAAPFDAAKGADGLFLPLPLDDSDSWASVAAKTMREKVGERCRLFRVDVQEPATADEPRRRFVVGIDDSWKVGTDTDRRAGCDRGWTVYLDPEAAQPQADVAYLQCTPD